MNLIVLYEKTVVLEFSKKNLSHWFGVYQIHWYLRKNTSNSFR